VGGWEEVLSKTNVSVFRSADPTGTRMFLRVDDTNALFARVVGYETMADVDTGTGPFPTPFQMSGGGYWHKSTTAGAAAVRWKMSGDGKFFNLAICPYVGSSSGDPTAAPARGFGDPIIRSPSGDAWSCVLSVSGTSSSNGSFATGAFDASSTSSIASGATFCPRGFSGLGSSALIDIRPFSGTRSSFSGADSFMGALPSSIDGEIKTAGVFGLEQGSAAAPPRMVIPGVYFIPQSGAIGVLADGDILQGSGVMTGKRLLVISTGGTSGSSAGRYLVDITGPNWRS